MKNACSTLVVFFSLTFGVFLYSPAKAEFILTITQVGADVIASGSGTIDLTAAGNPAQVSVANFAFEEVAPNAATYYQAGLPSLCIFSI